MIDKKRIKKQILKAGLLGKLAFSALCPALAQEIVSLSAVNSPYDEQHPVVSPSGDLFYTLGFHSGGHDPGDIWKSVRTENKDYQSPEKITELSTKGYDVVVGFLDERTILVYHDGKERSQGIHSYTLTGNTWSHQEQLDIGSFRNRSSHFSGRLAPSGDILILSLESYGSYGNEDIYVSFLKERGKWTSPQNLGPEINTYQQEMTPYLSANKQVLFFSTNGHGSTQGRDIYYSQRLDESWENWSQPQPLTIGNTPGAELSYLPLEGEADLAIYTTTQNSEGYGDLQIIQATIHIPYAVAEQPEEVAAEVSGTIAKPTPAEVAEIPEVPAPIVPVEEEPAKVEVVAEKNEPIEIEEQKLPEPAVKPETVPVAPDSVETAEGLTTTAFPLKVLDINTFEPIAYSIAFIDSQGKILHMGKDKDEEGSLPSDLDSAKEWLVASPGYLPLRIKSPTSDRTREPVLMTPAAKGVSMVLEDVLFKRGTAELLEENSGTLINSLADFLNSNPAVRILLEGHTDNLGNAQLNKELSLDRASAIRRLLVDQGVEFERIRIAGWGGSKPIASNQTEEGRTKNRRVEMIIVE